MDNSQDCIFLPSEETKQEIYSPSGIINKFQTAINNEPDGIKSVFNKKNKYKQLIEMWYALPLSIMFYNLVGDRYFILPSDSPDIYFILLNDNNIQEQKGFSVEIVELYQHNIGFDQDYNKMAEHIWNIKGLKDYYRTSLLIISRNNSMFDIGKFFDEIIKYEWKFDQIYLQIYPNDKTCIISGMFPEKSGGFIKHEVDLSSIPF